MTRAESAAAAGISRKLAAFHLEKLVEAGLLRSDVAPRSRHTVGRPPKAYALARREVMLSIPPRRSEVLAGILVEAVLAESPGETAGRAASRVAHDRGVASAQSAGTQQLSGDFDPRRPLALALVADLLDRQGYEPEHGPRATVRLRNCPFAPLASEAPELVCALNRAFVAGLLTGLEATALEAVLRPKEGECCVEVRPKRSRGATSGGPSGGIVSR